MPRIDIELTSSRPDGSWTWRAAGARQPRGTLDGSLLHAGAKPGEVVRADVEVDVDGMTVTAILPPKTKRADSERIELIGPPPREREEVSIDRAPRRPGDRGSDVAGGPRRPSGGGRDRDRDRDRDRERPGGGPPRPGGGPPRPGGGPPRRERSGPSRPVAPGSGPSRPVAPGSGRPHGGGERAERSRPPREEPRRDAPRAPEPPAPKPRPKRLHAGRVHRDAVLASLPPEERPIAEQVLRGGIPGVRQALEEQNAAARAAGAPQVKTDALVALAERMLPRLRAAEWRDRADAAVAQVDEVALRDLRALVAGSDAAARDEVSRELAGRLRHALEERSGKERNAWLAEITDALEAGRVVRALRSSSRPPEPGVRFPAELAERLGAAASDALGPDVAPDRWAAVLEAVTASPVRRVVRPRGLPAEAPEDLRQAARQAADRVPGLVPLVGAPPPPRGPASNAGGKSRRPSGAGGGLRPPPRPGARPPLRPPPRPSATPPPPAAEAEAVADPEPVADDVATEPSPDVAAEAAERAEPHAEAAEGAAEPTAEGAAEPTAEGAAEPPTAAAVEPPSEAAAEPHAEATAAVAEPPTAAVAEPADPPPAAAEGGEPEVSPQSGDDGDDAVLVEELG